MKLIAFSTLATWLLLAHAVAAQQFLLLPDSGNDRVLLLNPLNGAIVNSSFISDPTRFSTIIAAIHDAQNGRILVSDQVADAVFAYDMNGNFIETLVDASDGLDNIRGIAYRNNQLYVTVGGNTGGLVDTIQRFDSDGSNRVTWASTAVASPFDILFRQNDALVSAINSDNIERYDLSGNHLDTFHNSDGVSGIDFPQQIFEDANGDIWVSGFSPPAGLYRYSSTGTQLQYEDAGLALRGVFRLGNGNLLVTGGTRLDVYDPNTDSFTTLVNEAGASFRFLHLADFTPIPEPATLLLGGIGITGAAVAGWKVRRRRKAKADGKRKLSLAK